MIPFVDLKVQYRSIKEEIDTAVLAVLDKTQFILGDEVKAFEEEFAAYSGAKYGLGCSSGTSALHLALVATDIGPGDEVITVPYTFVATVSAIQYAGATPVLVDIDPDSYTMDPEKLEAAITPRTKAIMPVHLYGQPADMDPILKIAKKHGLLVIEDAAQAHGSEYKGRRAGGLGRMGCFSFYPGKNLGAYGEGGMVVTDDEALVEKLRILRSWGESKRYYHDLKGFNYRMDGIQGAVLRVKLRYLEKWTEQRREHAALYDRLFADSSVITPPVKPYSRHVYHVYVLRVTDRPAVERALTEAEIQYGIHYPVPVHLQKAYRDLNLPEGSFPVAEKVAGEVISLPVYPELTDGQIEFVVRTVKGALGD